MSLVDDSTMPMPQSLATLVRSLTARGGWHHVVGAPPAAAAALSHSLALTGRRVLQVTADAAAASAAQRDLRHFSRGLPLPGTPLATPATAPVRLLTAPEESPWAQVHPDRRATLDRVSTLFALARGDFSTLVTDTASLLRRVPPAAELLAAGIEFAVGRSLELPELCSLLEAMGYLRTPLVEDAGSFAIRGGLVDLWPAGDAEPVRAELDGDHVVSLRHFEAGSQRSGRDCPAFWLSPAREALLTDRSRTRAQQVVRALADEAAHPSSKTRRLVEEITQGASFFGATGFLPAYFELVPLWSLLPAGQLVVVVEEPERVVAALPTLSEAHHAEQMQARGPHFDHDQLFVAPDEVQSFLESSHLVGVRRVGVAGAQGGLLSHLLDTPPEAPSLGASDHQLLSASLKQGRLGQRGSSLDPLVAELRRWSQDGLRVVLTARSELQAERLATLLGHRKLKIAVGDAPAANCDLRISIGPQSRGLVAPGDGLVLLTEEEIFGQRNRRLAPAARKVKRLTDDLRALQPGDYVVHVEHGIGRYSGLERKVIAGIEVELLVLHYAAGDRLFVPVHRLHQVQKYAGAGADPKLDRLGGQSFAKTKTQVRRRLLRLADDLLRLYAERAQLHRPPLPARDDELASFEAAFPFEETPDQAAAIAEVHASMESPLPMDRLVCGDVGFGKTEVALRAAFRAAMVGRQVALLCPTTVLAQQHFNTFRERLAPHGLEVRVMSRFESKSAQASTLSGLVRGIVDVVIGTHRLLSKDVQFKQLGLLVVDEEHRFGVSHKERIKQIRGSVDVLTLSATPIPRTLQMAVGGLRDLSVIATPPMDRRSVRTLVARFEQDLVSEAITRELSRGGQVFFVHNRIEGLFERAAQLRQWLPQARVVVAHGQMGERELEQAMMGFVAGDFDVLASTAIIESGLDIPRANTILIDRADLFGLAQLHQLRGRVGRSSERAWCYLLVPVAQQLTEEARQRVEALERFSDLGSGLHLATLDMELRGAGDLLGAEQSGFVASVGFDLFCSMLEDARRELQGETVVHDVDPELNLDVETLLPEDYVAEVGLRLALYKRLAIAGSEEEVDDVATELEERFGPPPLPARQLLQLSRLRPELRRLRALACDATRSSVSLRLREDTPLEPVRLAPLLGGKNPCYRVTPDGRLLHRPAQPMANGLQALERTLSELSELSGRC
jgi:transcription-repair coupling factor (superfamily II helicase)